MLRFSEAFPSEPSSDKHVVVFFRLPGDTRTRVGFLTFDSTIHFYNLQEGLSQPQMLVVSDIDGTLNIVFLTSDDENI